MDQLVSKSPSRKHRKRYTVEFKAMVVAASNESGQSIASIAQQYNLNANLLHRWRKEHDVSNPADFIRLPAPVTSIASDDARGHEAVHIDLPGSITVRWPIEVAQKN